MKHKWCHSHVSTNFEEETFNENVYDRTFTEKVSVSAISAVVGDITSVVRAKVFAHLNHDRKYSMHMNTGGLKSTLELAIDLHYDCTVNLDVEDGLTNGATCTLQKIEYRSETKISAILWVLFLDPIVGKIWRQRYRSFYQEYKQILDTDICITRTLTVYRSLVSRQQFPICLSSARTIHKCQGKTLSNAVIKMGTRKSPHSHYTAFSCVTSLDNLHILHLNEIKIAVHDCVQQEMSDLRENRQVNLCYTPVYQLSPAQHRIIFHSIRSLHVHFDDVQCDPNYKAADVLAFAESRLSHCDDSNFYKLNNFHAVLRNDQVNYY